MTFNKMLKNLVDNMVIAVEKGETEKVAAIQEIIQKVALVMNENPKWKSLDI